MQNSFVEKFNGRLRDECLRQHLVASYTQAQYISETGRKDYICNRPHANRNGLTPIEFAIRSNMDWNLKRVTSNAWRVPQSQS